MPPYQYIIIVGCGRLGSLLANRLSGLGTVGLSVGVTTTDTPATLLLVETVGMFLGRLEFFTIVVGLIKLMTDIPPLLSPNPKLSK